LLLGFLLSAVHEVLGSRSKDPSAPSPFPYLGAMFAVTGSYFFEPSFSNLILKDQLFLVVAFMLLAARLTTPQPSLAKFGAARWTPPLDG